MQSKLPHQIAYVDEAGIDNREDYPYGYCEIGQRFYALKSGKRSERVSWIAALKAGGLFAPMTFAGSCNRDLFELWLEQCLVPQLKPGDVIVIDNASFHQGQAIEEIVAQAGCEIWYLPPILQTSMRLSIGGLPSRTGCDSDGMSLRPFVIVSMLLSKTVLTSLRSAIYANSRERS